MPPGNTHLADDGRAACTDTVLGQTMTELATQGRDPKFSSGPGIQISRVLTSLLISKINTSDSRRSVKNKPIRTNKIYLTFLLGFVGTFGIKPLQQDANVFIELQHKQAQHFATKQANSVDITTTIRQSTRRL